MKNIILEKEAEIALINYDWPGNIRELKNAIEFAINMMDGNEIKSCNLPTRMQAISNNSEIKLRKLRKLSEIVEEAEKREIKNALKLFGNDINGKKKAAKALGISLATLYNKLKE
jgi:transcriptional regulator with PAS, ATPase and Fis domain